MASSSFEEEVVDLHDEEIKVGDKPSVESAGSPADSAAKKKKKKILRAVPAREVKYVMNYKAAPQMTEWPDSITKNFPELAACYYATMANTAEVVDNNQQKMLEKQKDYKQQLEANGTVTYEVEVDEDYDQEKDYTPLHPPGRRRHRPGVMKNRQGEARRLN
ncbi:hypothetical protein D1007_60528 [Hordeum vulgare]|nr:hypothetical protein D1007_60528 [Hordeum vulgare]